MKPNVADPTKSDIVVNQANPESGEVFLRAMTKGNVY